MQYSGNMVAWKTGLGAGEETRSNRQLAASQSELHYHTCIRLYCCMCKHALDCPPFWGHGCEVVYAEDIRPFSSHTLRYGR